MKKTGFVSIIYKIYLPLIILLSIPLTGYAAGDTPILLKSDKQSAEQTANKPADAVNAALERILAGDFAGAQKVCDTLGGDFAPSFTEFSNILKRYDEVQKDRSRYQVEAYEEQLREISKQKDKVKDDVFEPNDIDLVLSSAIRAREYAAESKKDDILKDSFIKKAIENAKKQGQKYEDEGKWIDSYAHCYYWLTLLYEDEQSYKDHIEMLTEMASIELSLKKSDCGETAMERYKGIEPFMFVRALQILEANYVNGIDYGLMCEKAIQRCKLLGRVLVESKEDLAWKVEPEQLPKWLAGLDSIDAGPKDKNRVKTVQDIARLFDDITTLDEITLKLPPEVLIAHFSEAALLALDPFTNLVWPWNVKDFEKSLTQQFSGIGVEISKQTGVLKIGSLLPDTPAYRAGLDAEDEIIAVNGESTEKMSIFCAVSKITGPKGTKVKLSIRRPSAGTTWDVTIVRDRIAVQPLRGWQRKLDGQWDWSVDPVNKIGYVRLTAFTESSGPDLDKTLTEMEKAGLNGLILDLRYNSGGYLQSAAEVVDLFVREGVIVKSAPRHGLATYEIAHAKGTHPDYPLVLLINEGSASASEIVAGALQDPKHNRATLVGERSYGKGSVQIVTEYPGGGSQLKYTIAYYHLPGDQPVKNRYQMEKLHRKDWGIAPDVEVKINTAELRKMLDIQRDNDVLVQVGHDEEKAPMKRHTLQQTLNSDPQLAIGLLVLQSKMAGKGISLKLPDDPNTLVVLNTNNYKLTSEPIANSERKSN